MEIISVIVPVYKVEKFLNKCIQSIVNQTYINLEIILVDDGSPDNCPSICDEWERKDKRIKVIHKNNGGLSDARNAGMKIATGQYIGFVDGDDYIAPRMYEELLKSIYDSDSDIAACSVEKVWEDSDRTQLLTINHNCILNTVEAELAIIRDDQLKNPVWYKLYKAELIKNISFEIGRLHEDVFWTYQAIGKAHKVSVINYIGYFYIQRSQSIMEKPYSKKRLDTIVALQRRVTYMKENFPELEQAAAFSLCNQCVYQGQLVIKYLRGLDKSESLQYLKNIYATYYSKSFNDFNLKITHKVWNVIGRISFTGECRLRNLFNIGI